MQKNSFENSETIISLLNIYLTEWIHRDKILWSQVFKLFYAILIIILLPNISEYLKISLPSIPTILFRILGLLFSFVFLYICLGYLKRLEAIGNSYQNLINKLPPEYRRQNVRDLHMGKLFSYRTSYIICFLLFSCLISLSIVLIMIKP